MTNSSRKHTLCDCVTILQWMWYTLNDDRISHPAVTTYGSCFCRLVWHAAFVFCTMLTRHFSDLWHIPQYFTSIWHILQTTLPLSNYSLPLIFSNLKKAARHLRRDICAETRWFLQQSSSYRVVVSCAARSCHVRSTVLRLQESTGKDQIVQNAFIKRLMWLNWYRPFQLKIDLNW